MIEKDAFDSVFKEHYGILKIYARRFVIDADVADDLVQDVFCNIWKMRKDFTPEGSVKSYLFTAVYHKCLNYIKHKKIENKHQGEQVKAQQEFIQYFENKVSSYEESILSEELISELKKAITELPDQCQRIFLLSRKFGLKNREIADFLQISIQGVERQIAKAMKTLYDQLKEKR